MHILNIYKLNCIQIRLEIHCLRLKKNIILNATKMYILNIYIPSKDSSISCWSPELLGPLKIRLLFPEDARVLSPATALKKQINCYTGFLIE